MKRLRWALARLFAPEPVMRDPFPDEKGVFVYYRSGPHTDKYRLEWVMQAERFRLKSTSRLAALDYPRDAFAAGLLYRPGQPFVRFVGTIGASHLAKAHDTA